MVQGRWMGAGGLHGLFQKDGLWEILQESKGRSSWAELSSRLTALPGPRGWGQG